MKPTVVEVPLESGGKVRVEIFTGDWVRSGVRIEGTDLVEVVHRFPQFTKETVVTRVEKISKSGIDVKIDSNTSWSTDGMAVPSIFANLSRSGEISVTAFPDNGGMHELGAHAIAGPEREAAIKT